ncbi:MAG: DNA-3-methyladenine glycosylase 2 family protein [Saprospiraceae bacterium]
MSYEKVLSGDARLRDVMQQIPSEHIYQITPSDQVREYLIKSIVSQQLSVKVAPIILDRFRKIYGSRFPSNKSILNTDIETLRSAGLSYQKANYIRNIAEHFEINKLKNSDFASLDDEEIIARLTQIKGVGRWTVEMVLMFCLGRPDVFSPLDYGIRTAMVDIYKLRQQNKELEKKLYAIAEKWRPYRTTACLYMWAYKDLKKQP